MQKPKAAQQLNKQFLWSLLFMGIIISSTELSIMLGLEWWQEKSGRPLSSAENVLIDTLVLTLISTPLSWFLVLRRRVVTLLSEQEKAAHHDRKNKELRTALDAHALVSIADQKGLIIYANEKFCQVSGYSEDELLGKDHRIVNSGIHDKSYIGELWQTITQGKTWQGVICNRKKNGELYWVDNTIMPMLNEEGKPSQYISIRRDITEQKNAETYLNILKRAVDACNEMIIITDEIGLVQYANLALYTFSGWHEGNLVGKPISVFNSPNADPKVLNALGQHLDRGESWLGRLLSRRKGIPQIRIAGQSLPPDPLEFWAEISITPVFNQNATLFGYVHILRDISNLVIEEIQQKIEKDDSDARLEVADILQRDLPLEDRFRTALEILFTLKSFDLQRKGGVFLKAPDDDILEMYLLQGSFSEEFIEKEQRVAYGSCLCGRAAVDNKILISDDCFCDPRHEHTFSGMKAHGHFIIPLAVGDDVLGIMFLYADPYPSQHESRLNILKQIGELMALAILREHTQTSLEKARDMAMQASVSKSEFLANVSHEIRTPMNGVLGMLELMRDTEMTRTQWELIETAHNSAESLLDIINDILDFSKLEAGKIDVEHVSFNLVVLVEEVSTLLARRAFTKGLELNCFLPADLNPKWLGDPMRIRQVLTNLIGNAIKFTEQGEVSITLKPISSYEELQIFRIEIRDTGIGIPANIQTRLFQPFTQAETATARRFGGTGLGLSICKSLVTLMGGTLGLESVAGEGSCFWFTLPLSLDDQKNREPVINFSGKRILVVDDNATNRMILNHYLTHWGLRVGLAECGQDALTELEAAHSANKPYELIILDMHMPGMDGLTLARKLANNPLFAMIPKIFLSSGVIINEDQRRELSITYSLLKPARQTQLFDAITESFGSQQVAKHEDINPGGYCPNYQTKKILVVEDNKVNQKVILGMLAKFNITPTVADNGQLALDQLAVNSFDLIFMDCQMPVMDGYETTTEIRRQEQATASSRHVIIALTAHAVTGEREKCIAAGMDDYLGKPIRREQLIAVLAQWLSPAVNDLEIALNEETLPLPITANAVWCKKEALKHLDNDEELLTDMIILFMDEIPQQLTNLHEACLQINLINLADTAHAIKGSVGHFCAKTATDCATQLENAARRNDAVDYQLLTTNLNQAVAALVDSFKQFMTV